MNKQNAKCTLCGSKSTKDHSCIQSTYAKHVIDWLMFDNIEPMGHPLGYRIQGVIEHCSFFNDYAKSISSVTKDRSLLHKQICNILDVDHNYFKPFEDMSIEYKFSYESALEYLFSAVVQYLWMHTTIYEDKNWSYKKMLSIKEKYFPDNEQSKLRLYDHEFLLDENIIERT